MIITPPVGDFDLPPSGEAPRSTSIPEPTPPPVIQPVPLPTAAPSAPRVPALRPTAMPSSRAIRVDPTPTRPASAASPLPSAEEIAPSLTPPATPTGESAPSGDSEIILPTPSSTPDWLWSVLAGALLLAGGIVAGWLFGRSRGKVEQDDPVRMPARGEGGVPALPPAQPSPSPPVLSRPPAQPRPSPAPTTPPPDAPLVTELRPLRASIRDGTITLDIELMIRNRGTEGADNIRAVLALLGANAQQDEQIAGFHAAARMMPGSEPFSLAPGSVHMLNAQISLPGDQMAVVNIQGKPMFVPVVPVMLRWYAGLSIRTLRDSFMVGTVPAPGSDRLGSLWVDRAADGFGRLAAKRYAPKPPQA